MHLSKMLHYPKTVFLVVEMCMPEKVQGHNPRCNDSNKRQLHFAGSRNLKSSTVILLLLRAVFFHPVLIK